MKYTSKKIVFQEVPDYIALSFLISGCGLKCKGCHSSHSYNGNVGTVLSVNKLKKEIAPIKNKIGAVLFLGGEWEKDNLIKLLSTVKDMGLATCLYTGLEYNKVNKEIIEKLDYIKTGPYIKKLGGLSSKTTNQRYYSLSPNKEKKDLTYLFHKNK